MDQHTPYYTILQSVNRYGSLEYRVLYLPSGYIEPCRLRGVYRGEPGENNARAEILAKFPGARQLQAQEFRAVILQRQQEARETEPIILAVALTPSEFANLRTALARRTGIQLEDEELRSAARHLAQMALRTLSNEAEQSQSEGEHQITADLDTEQFERFRKALAQHYGTAPENFNTFLVHWSGKHEVTELINTYCDEAEQHQQ